MVDGGGTTIERDWRGDGRQREIESERDWRGFERPRIVDGSERSERV